MASTTAPRPILKSSSRKSSTSSTSSCDSIISSSSRGPCVQFSACLSTTYLTHASTDYNRCPIDVTPNTLAMPKRGCPGRTYRDEQAALVQFRMEAEGRSMPALVSDDGFSSSEESDASIPSPSAYTPSFPIPPSLMKSSRSSHGGRRSKPASRSYGHNSSYSIPASSPCFEEDGRDDIFGGF